MLHGWVGSADLNFGGLYEDVVAAGYRLVAIDHRGHGRGPRPLVPFRLVDCAADAAAVIRTLELGPVIVYGYSMGGAIAQLVARDHPDVVSGLVLSGTASTGRKRSSSARGERCHSSASGCRLRPAEAGGWHSSAPASGPGRRWPGFTRR